MKIWASVLCVLCCFLLIACHRLKKDAVRARIADSTQFSLAQPDTPLLPSDTDTTQALVYQKILAHNTLDYTFLTAKISADYQEEQNNYHLIVHLRTRKDSIIWMAVYTFGIIEAFRVRITPDSFFLWNRLQGQIERHPLSYVRNLLGIPLDFSALQSFLLGQAYYAFPSPVQTSECGWQIHTLYPSFERKDCYNMQDTLLSESRFLIAARDSLTALAIYAQPFFIANGHIPQQHTLSLNGAQKSLHLSLFFESIQLPPTTSFPFRNQ